MYRQLFNQRKESVFDDEPTNVQREQPRPVRNLTSEYDELVDEDEPLMTLARQKNREAGSERTSSARTQPIRRLAQAKTPPTSAMAPPRRPEPQTADEIDEEIERLRALKRTQHPEPAVAVVSKLNARGEKAFQRVYTSKNGLAFTESISYTELDEKTRDWINFVEMNPDERHKLCSNSFKRYRELKAVSRKTVGKRRKTN